MIFNNDPKNYFFYISLVFNFIFLNLIVVLVYFYNKLDGALQNVTLNFNTLELNMDQKFSSLNNEVLLLKAENLALMEKLNLTQMLPEKISPLSLVLPIVPNVSGDYPVFIMNVVLTAFIFIIASVFIYSLSTHTYAWFFKGLVGELIILSNKLIIQLHDLLGFVDTKSILFKDGLGNEFLIKLSHDNKVIDILV
jgi:hypothetical protein